MSFSTCPVATVNAPVSQVWDLLADPDHYARWWDAQTLSISPAGRAHAGQKIHAQSSALGRQWDIEVMVERVDEAGHQIDLTTMLPLGITGHHHLTCTPLNGTTTRVAFG